MSEQISNTNPTQSNKLAALLEKISHTASLSPEEATSMPPEAFTSEELLEWERERIFSKEWICVGREDELQSPGAYFTTEVNQVPVIITRKRDNELQALINICRHRMAKVAEGQGKTRVFTCPYHAWAYDLDGKLINAPKMENKNFDKSNCPLQQLRLETWLGFIFVNLDSDAKPLAPRLQSFQELIRNYHVEEMASVWKKAAIWNTNWKILVENFLESYHIQAVHKDTLYPYGGYEEVEPIEQGEGYNFYMQGQIKDAGLFDGIISPEVLIENADLGELEKFNTPVGCIYPNLLISISWFGVLWISAQPISTAELRVEWGALGPVKGLPINAESYEQYQFPNLVNMVNNEDKPRTEDVYHAAKSGRAAVGPLHPSHEETILHFIRYLSRQLAS